MLYTVAHLNGEVLENLDEEQIWQSCPVRPRLVSVPSLPPPPPLLLLLLPPLPLLCLCAFCFNFQPEREAGVSLLLRALSTGEQGGSERQGCHFHPVHKCWTLKHLEVKQFNLQDTRGNLLSKLKKIGHLHPSPSLSNLMKCLQLSFTIKCYTKSQTKKVLARPPSASEPRTLQLSLPPPRDKKGVSYVGDANPRFNVTTLPQV